LLKRKHPSGKELRVYAIVAVRSRNLRLLAASSQSDKEVMGERPFCAQVPSEISRKTSVFPT
jgi:hypothetical protein